MAKIIGNTTATPNPRPDWNQTDETKADYIRNKPVLEWDYVITNEEQFAKIGEMTGKILVKSDGNFEFNDVFVELRNGAEVYFDGLFTILDGCTVYISMLDDYCTVNGGVFQSEDNQCEGYLKLECLSSATNIRKIAYPQDPLSIMFEFCNNISNCDFTHLDYCNNINNCVLVNYEDDITGYVNECSNISNILYNEAYRQWYGKQSQLIMNCHNVSNISPALGLWGWDNTNTDVDIYTCPGYVGALTANRVYDHIITKEEEFGNISNYHGKVLVKSNEDFNTFTESCGIDLYDDTELYFEGEFTLKNGVQVTIDVDNGPAKVFGGVFKAEKVEDADAKETTSLYIYSMNCVRNVRTTSDLTHLIIDFEGCSNISECDFTNLNGCRNVTNCEFASLEDDIAGFILNSNMISNITTKNNSDPDWSGAETQVIQNCYNISNISGLLGLWGEWCFGVDPYTCPGYIGEDRPPVGFRSGISEGSVQNINSVAGCMGFKYTAESDFSASQNAITFVLSEDDYTIAKGVLTEGDVISFVNGSKYINYGTITAFPDDACSIVVTRVSEPDEVYSVAIPTVVKGGDGFDDSTLFCLDKSDVGNVDVGQFSLAGGVENRALAYCGTAFGRGNTIESQYGTALGRGNTARYAAVALNRECQALGNNSLAGGWKSIARHNTSAAWGWGLQTNAPYQTVFGKFNDCSEASNTDTAIFVVGCGWDNKRPGNALVIQNNGETSFGKPVTAPEPTNSDHLTTKNYVDTNYAKKEDVEANYVLNTDLEAGYVKKVKSTNTKYSVVPAIKQDGTQENIPAPYYAVSNALVRRNAYQINAPLQAPDPADSSREVFEPKIDQYISRRYFETKIAELKAELLAEIKAELTKTEN